MKKLTLALAAAVASMALPAVAAPVPVCLQTILIDHTSVVDANTVLFHMKDGSVWRNKLPYPCPSLNFHGFEMSVKGGIDQVCSNQQPIHVLITHQACMLGEFTPYTPSGKVPADRS